MLSTVCTYRVGLNDLYLAISDGLVVMNGSNKTMEKQVMAAETAEKV